MSTERKPIEWLIARSSFGTTGAVRIRARAPEGVVEEIVTRSEATCVEKMSARHISIQTTASTDIVKVEESGAISVPVAVARSDVMAKQSSGGRGGGVHTTPNPTGSGWVNQVNGHVTSTHRLKERAVDAGRLEAERRGTEHTIHNRDGRIGEKNSYGNDPPEKKG